LNPYQEIFDKKYYGNYRGQIVEVNNDVKNGLYKVKIYPFFANIETTYLPYAQSNLTTENSNENLKVDDIVWCFCEQGNAHFPIIFSKCNIKDKLPDDCFGEQPDYWNDIEANTDISESTVNYEGEYNKIFSKKFGNNIRLYIDEENETIVLRTSKGYVIIDSEGDFHSKLRNLYITTTEDLKVGVNSLFAKIENDGLDLEVGNDHLKINSTDGFDLTIGTNTIKADSTGVIINNNLQVLV
jgi:hypothetical protein